MITKYEALVRVGIQKQWRRPLSTLKLLHVY